MNVGGVDNVGRDAGDVILRFDAMVRQRDQLWAKLINNQNDLTEQESKDLQLRIQSLERKMRGYATNYSN